MRQEKTHSTLTPLEDIRTTQIEACGVMGILTDMI